MNKPRRSLLRRARFAIGALLATLLIAAAAAMALGQLLLPLLHEHPQKVAQLLSWRLQQPVSIGAVDGQWQPSGPLLSATNLRIGNGAHALTLPHAQLKVDFGAWLKRDTRWLELRVTGLQANIRRDAGGAWQLAGLVNQGQPTDASTLTDLPVGLLLRDLDVNVDDAKSQRHWHLHASLVRAISRGDNLRMAARVSVEPGASPLSVVLHIQSSQHSAQVYVAGDNVDLAAWTSDVSWSDMRLDAGHAEHVQAWLDWRAGELHDATAILALKDVRLSAPKRGALAIARWDGRVQAHRDGDAWRATWVDTRATHSKQPSASVSVDWQPRAGGGAAIDAQAKALDIGELAPWLAWLPQVPSGLRHWLQTAAPHGRVDSAKVHWVDVSHYDAQAQLRDVGFASVGTIPGANGFDGTLRADAQAASLELPPQAMTISDPKVFRQPFALSRIAGTLALWRRGDAWQLGSDDVQIHGNGFAVNAHGSVTLAPDSSPLLDLSAVVTHADVPAAKQFWPVNVMPPEAVKWLDDALVSGTVSGARAVFRGHLADWPFRNASGHFDAVATLHDATLDYESTWPRAEHVAARARFVNAGMQVTADSGRALGNVLDSASADIDDFDDATLKLQLRAHGDRGHAMQFVRQSPLGKRFASALHGLNVTGKAAVNLHLSLPLHDADDTDTILKGRAQLSNAVFTASAWSLKLNKLSGALDFDKAGFLSDGLRGEFHAQPVALAVNVGDAVADATHQLEATMRGRFDTATLLQGFDSLQWLADLGRGKADVDIGLNIPAGTDIGAAKPRLSVASDLRGMALTLAAPLNKSADTNLPLQLSVGMPFAGSTLNLQLGDLLNARLRLADASQPLAGDIALGGPAGTPLDHGIIVHGHVATMDLSGWIDWAIGLTGSAGQNILRQVDVVAKQVDVFGQHFKNLALKLKPETGKTVLTLAGEQAAGSISVPASGLLQRGITAKLQRLYWPDDDVAPASTASVDAAPGIAPSSVPPLHLWIGDLRLGHARLGETRFESYPTAGGMHVEQLDTHSPDVQISARGDWTGTAGHNHTHLAIDFSSADLGRMLNAFGYPGLVAGGTTLAHVDGTWPGPPSAFSLADMDGSMKVHVEEGRVLNVEPGVGRLFGLFSIRQLPRRLSLDFGDLFKSGFSFNSIDGNFAFSDGNAHTHNLRIRGPAAAIAITGRTGLRQHDYDQYIDVSPHVGATLPIVGAIAGGPLGAAAGLAVQSLLGHGLGKAAGARYHVSGSWKNPTITLLSRDRKPGAGKPAAASSAPMPVTPVPAASRVAPAPAASVAEPAQAASG